ncbi:MAG: hypothetical protein JWR11_2451, partial [Mycobacterium sp.]|nr:hypothetical protein [Mycobacterium sp.]
PSALETARFFGRDELTRQLVLHIQRRRGEIRSELDHQLAHD